MPIKNKYAIYLEFPQTFRELLYRVEFCRNNRQSLYNLAYSIKPYITIEINQNTSIETINSYNAVITETINAINSVDSFYEQNSNYKVLYTPTSNNLNAQQSISSLNPLTTSAAENLVYDIDNLHKGVVQILKSYGKFDVENKLWVMDSREATFTAYQLILDSYTIFPQLIYNFAYPTTPTLPQLELDTTTENTNTPVNPVLKAVYDNGLNVLLNKKANTLENTALSALSNQGKLQIRYYKNDGSLLTLLDPVINFNSSTVTDENNFNVYAYVESQVH